MRRIFRCLRRETIAQDLVEYSLLLALIGLSAGAVFLHAGTDLGQIWNSADQTLVEASDAIGGDMHNNKDKDKNKDKENNRDKEKNTNNGKTKES